MNENRILQIMKTLDLTREETLQMLADDNKIDHNEKMPFDLSAEQEKNVKKLKNVARTVDAYGKKRTRTVKEDEEKLFLIKLIADTLGEQTQTLAITNPQREINFNYNNRKFKIVLSAPRN